ncbi:Sulfotransferase domain protein [Stieleria maiorica]|uniref:Sulfotransferase domain protein n=1 Tax=Stieleria maiorica TaxID=2795974 RepID=A0A5B9MU29_9BACT|nr:sulfotransferase [Stieleria maiorica]QEG02558.1 Sulfotransferase domain protein [Stieleria maiorica]
MTDTEHRRPAVPADTANLADKATPADRTKRNDKAAVKPQAEFHRYPFYAPRFWHGMRPRTWWGLLRQGRFRIHPSRLPNLLGVSLATPWNTVLAWIQQLFFRKRLAEAELHGPPVFIIGHWRSGTTLLHELLVLDERYSSPTTFQCFAPHHFLVTEWIFQRFFGWLLPGKRPMDNMAAGWERPQEDEFALMNLGLPSPYRHIAFPCEPPVDLNYLDFQDVSPTDLQRWLRALRRFLLGVSTVTGRPLVIKSPTHTGRIAALAKEFPDARFIHVTRDPRALFPSTCRLWAGLAEAQGMQVARDPADDPTAPGGDDQKLNPEKQYVVDCLRRMYDAFLRDRPNLDPNRIVDIRYEDLVADPVAILETVYRSLKLSDFDSVRPVIESWAASEHRSYRTNRHQLSDQDEATIRSAWKHYFETYGY